jgi:hypothetical protein
VGLRPSGSGFRPVLIRSWLNNVARADDRKKL